jgi:PAS domain S-box-containing protein
MNAASVVPDTRVFIVEDEALIAMELQDHLASLGYVVCGTALRGEQALEEIPRSSPDLVLMDVRLAGALSGIETADRLRQKLDVPVIFLSAYSDGELLRQAREVQPFGYLTKPFEERELHANMQMAIYKHRMERALRESHARLETLAALSPVGIARMDTQAHCQYVNDRYCEILGIGREEALATEWLRTAVDDRDRERVISEWRRARQLGKPLRCDCRFLRAGGDTVFAVAQAVPVRDALGALSGYIGTLTDITEQKNAERQLNRTHRLEAIGTLAGGIAHDLNNALTPILLAFDLLKELYPAEHELLDTVEQSAKHAAEMVRQLLAFAKGSEGRRVSLQPRRLLGEIAKIVRGTFPKSIEVCLSVADDLPDVLGDATQLHQVLLNLCVNARDAMTGGGTLTLEADTVDATSVPDAPDSGDSRPSHYVVLRVADTGTGIPPEVLERIFDPFFTTKEPESGTGLGLFSAAGIVKGHGGFIRVFSQPPKGSTFAVYLPAEKRQVDAEVAPSSHSTFHGQGEIVLLVDDESAVRETARTVLERLNFTPLTANDGMDGLTRALQTGANLRAVITDVHMPNMDGLSFVRALRQSLPDTPIIVASGRLEPNLAQEFAKLGVQVTLDKPFTQGTLADALRTALAEPND